MRVLDLLEMLRDISKNTPVRAHLEEIEYAITATEVINEQLIINLTKNDKSLKNWELSLMLNKPERLYLPIFIQIDKKNHQVFGLRLDDGKIVLY